MTAVNGRPSLIKPGKPVYHAAFKRLTEDKVLQSRLDLSIVAELLTNEQKSVQKYEEELQVLGSLPKQPREVGPRVSWLLNKLANSQGRIEKYELETASLQKTLRLEY